MMVDSFPLFQLTKPKKIIRNMNKVGIFYFIQIAIVDLM